MRAVALVAVLGVAAVVACTAWSAVDPKDPQQRHTAADTRLAQSLALRAADLAAGWKSEKPAGSGPACVGEPDESTLVQTARIDPSFVWQDKLTRIGSEVDVFKTAAMARRDWVLSTLKLTTSCLLQDASTEFGKSVHVTLVSSQTLAPPGHAERSLHYRLVLAVHSTQTVRIVTDVVALGRGRITVVLHALTLTAPLPASGLTMLATTLAGRLDAGGIGI